MYGVLYAISPEIFPAKDRGTGNGLTATAARLFAILVRRCLRVYLPQPPFFEAAKDLLRSCLPLFRYFFHGRSNIHSHTLHLRFQSPIIALYADLETAVPVYVSGGLILFAGALALALPFEPRGKASL